MVKPYSWHRCTRKLRLRIFYECVQEVLRSCSNDNREIRWQFTHIVRQFVLVNTQILFEVECRKIHTCFDVGLRLWHIADLCPFVVSVSVTSTTCELIPFFSRCLFWRNGLEVCYDVRCILLTACTWRHGEVLGLRYFCRVKQEVREELLIQHHTCKAQIRRVDTIGLCRSDSIHRCRHIFYFDRVTPDTGSSQGFTFGCVTFGSNRFKVAVLKVVTLYMLVHLRVCKWFNTPIEYQSKDCYNSKYF